MDSPQKNNKILVSACLAGINCTFRGTNNLKDNIKKMADSKQALAICPEVSGGLGVGRENIELVGGDGNDVLDGRARAITSGGRDVTENVIAGAKKVLDAAKKAGIKKAVLKSNSPTCGSGSIYDGTFSKRLRPGDGVLAALLKRSGISVMTEDEY
jgi:uncharacterized protein YbbK (DUF523 family)